MLPLSTAKALQCLGMNMEKLTSVAMVSAVKGMLSMQILQKEQYHSDIYVIRLADME